MNKIVLAIIILISSLSFSQSKGDKETDSLKAILRTQTNKKQFNTLITISNIYAGINLDSSKHYASKAFKLSDKIGNDSLKIKALMFLGHRRWESGNYNKSIENFNKSLSISNRIEDPATIAGAYNGLSIAYGRLGNITKSIEYNFKTLKLYEKLKDSAGMGACYLNIAWSYRKLKEYPKSIDYNEKALRVFSQLKDSMRVAMVNNNIAGNLNDLGDYKNAIKFSNKSKKYFLKLNYERYAAYPLGNIAISQDSLGNYKEAEKKYQKAIELHTINKEPYELAFLNNAFANLNYNLGNYDKALLKGKEAIRFAEEAGAIEFVVSSSKTLAKTYEKLNQFNQSNTYLKTYIKYNDSILNNEKLKAIAEVETKYETEKKEKEILAQRAEIAEKELSLNKKNTQIIGLSIAAVLLSILGYLIYNQQKLKNHQLQKEGELKEALVKIDTQNRLQNQRLRISRDLHDNIGAQLTFIISSIENLQYGFSIKNEKLNDKLKNISGFTKETIYELRDTIWAMNKHVISLEDLQIRTSNFIDKADLSLTNTTFSFNIDRLISKDIEFKSTHGMNIYRIIQESVNNAIKYAKSSTIEVAFKQEVNNLIVSITDNGIGFNEAEIDFGSGLNNIKKRAEDIGAKIKIESKLDNGTKVVIFLNEKKSNGSDN